MNTRFLNLHALRLAVVVVGARASASCGSELLRTGRSPVYLTIDGVSLLNGATDDAGSTLLSDVQTLVEQQINGQTVRVPTIFNDVATFTLGVVAKDPTQPTTAMNAVTVNRYRIAFKRSDGRNTPGVDVPFGWDGGVSVTIPAGDQGEVVFEIVRHSTKSEPPLRNLVNNGGVQFIYTVAEITFFGRDQNGNEVTVTGTVDIAFSDFGDPS
jgi:hypothetical protein